MAVRGQVIILIPHSSSFMTRIVGAVFLLFCDLYWLIGVSSLEIMFLSDTRDGSILRVPENRNKNIRQSELRMKLKPFGYPVRYTGQI